MNQERLKQSNIIKNEILENFNKIEWEYSKLKMIIEEEVREQSFERFGGLVSDVELESLIKTHLDTYQTNKKIENMTVREIKESSNIEREVINLIKTIAKGL